MQRFWVLIPPEWFAFWFVFTELGKELSIQCLIHISVKPVSFFLRMRMQSEFWRHMAVFAATQDWNTVQLLQIIRCEFVTSEFISHSHSQQIWTGLKGKNKSYSIISLMQKLHLKFELLIFSFWQGTPIWFDSGGEYPLPGRVTETYGGEARGVQVQCVMDGEVWYCSLVQTNQNHSEAWRKIVWYLWLI